MWSIVNQCLILALLVTVLGLAVATFVKLDDRSSSGSARRTAASSAAEAKLLYIHSTLQTKHGSLDEEYPEQLLACDYVTPNSTVLELGANVGRNSLVLASLLSDPGRLVSIECDPEIAAHLRENRDANDLAFHVETHALSETRLVNKGWVSIPF